MMSSLGIPLVQGLRLLVNGPADRLAELPEPDEDCLMEPGGNLRSILDVLAGNSPVPVPELPPHLDRILRPYQKEGFSFLYRTTERGFGACLADDMGLGKTLQAIAWLDTLRRQGKLETVPALIVAPAPCWATGRRKRNASPRNLSCASCTLPLRIPGSRPQHGWTPHATPLSQPTAWPCALRRWRTCIFPPLFWMRRRPLKTLLPRVPAPSAPCTGRGGLPCPELPWKTP